MKHWYNNGTEVKYCEVCPEGFKLGRLTKKLNAAEQKNIDEVNVLIEQFSWDTIIEYYKTHTVNESINYFNTTANILKI